MDNRVLTYPEMWNILKTESRNGDFPGLRDEMRAFEENKPTCIEIGELFEKYKMYDYYKNKDVFRLAS